MSDTIDMTKPQKLMTDAIAPWLEKLSPERREQIRAMVERSRNMTEEERAEYLIEREAEIRRTQQVVRRRQALERSGLKGDQLKNGFNNYDPKDPTQKDALEAARRFAALFPNVKKGLMFWGAAGRGKDHLLHAITKAVITNERQIFEVKYFFSLDLAEEMLSEWQRHKDEDTDVEQVCRECDLLLIGDLDKVCPFQPQKDVDAVTDAIWRIINQAESVGKPIICASANTEEKKWDMTDTFMSRLADVFDWHEVKGEDARRKG